MLVVMYPRDAAAAGVGAMLITFMGVYILDAENLTMPAFSSSFHR
jgi:hypothetical protein